MSAFVSVLLTSYNHQKYIGEAIESVLSQTFADFELIIVDDCSNDGSWEVIKSYSDPRIVAIRNDVNRYMEGFRDVVLHVANGKYIAIHHSDDVWEPTKLEKQVAFMEEHDEYAACFTNASFIDEYSEQYELPEGNFYNGVFDKDNRSKEEWLNYFFYKGNCLCHPSVLIRREMYGEYGLFDINGIRQIPDFLMWVKLCLAEEIFIYPEKLTKFRLRRMIQENMSADKPEVHIRGQVETFFLLQEYLKIVDLTMFLKVFPQAVDFVKDNKINLEFALAKICLEKSRAYCWFGMERLFYLINDSVKATEIRELYQYTPLSYMTDSAKYDVFSITSDFRYIETSIFADYGNGFNSDDMFLQKLYFPPTNEFYYEALIPRMKNGEKIKRLRFDPIEGESVKIFLDFFRVNDVCVACEPINHSYKEQSITVFLSGDPQYIVDCGDDYDYNNNDLKVTIRGSIEFLNHNEREYLLQDIIRQSNAFQFERDNLIVKLDNIIMERDHIIMERDHIIMERDHAIMEQIAMKNTRGWRLLEKIRKVMR